MQQSFGQKSILLHDTVDPLLVLFELIALLLQFLKNEREIEKLRRRSALLMPNGIDFCKIVSTFDLSYKIGLCYRYVFSGCLCVELRNPRQFSEAKITMETPANRTV